ncbi:MAG: hypothetical protein PGN25_08320 [Methylorubrum populi]
MALDALQQAKAEVAAHKFINEALLAIILRLHSGEPIAQVVQGYVDERLTDSTVTGPDAVEFKRAIKHAAIDIIARGSNASKT